MAPRLSDRRKFFMPPVRPYVVAGILAVALVAAILAGVVDLKKKDADYAASVGKLEAEKSQLQGKIIEVQQEIDTLRHEDQRVRNDALESEIREIQKTYTDTVKAYEDVLKLKEQNAKTAKLDTLFSRALSELSKRQYATASVTLKSLSGEITALEQSIAASVVIPANVPENNSLPGGGYSRQAVKTEIGSFLVDIVAADLGSTRVLVDSASDSDCRNDCPVLSLSDYVSRNGGFAGINGSYFCPATYPSCQDKKNSFDTLLMNKNKVYINSDNNVYSTVPAVIFLSGSIRFVGRSLDWGRDTGVDGVLANQPLLLSGGNIAFTGDGDPKKGSKGPRSFVGSKDSAVYIGVVHNATVAEAPYVLKTLGMENALNLDSGGSTALWSGGYRVGPGRNIPNAIVFVRR
ncbi:hypothetical protein A2Z33_03065 [Candidatus Gottesmanbacteria bacterium RBG_16_52_11]|uniref:Phosphodiester glycosidase domain-containing protein n=1 Tax=Candidatus Gottesmanbacteria bacterium RBG_16_52_11 TaxID=1798374 RepID=A0A1F5YV85_9BACT|nr:MAG: hypothetical protein A2Z33_03065 [Candidatus Gottesmanbacteria bacterium RBG_16_52_11]